jgi:adenylate cyclase
MLTIAVTSAGQVQHLEHAGGPVEFGRGPRRQAPRIVIDARYVSRDQLRLEELPDGRVRVENLSHKNEVTLADGMPLPTGARRDFGVPLQLHIGDTRIDVDRGPSDAFDAQSLQTVALPVGRAGGQDWGRVLSELGEAPAPEVLAHWLETIIGLQRPAAGPAELYEHTARALVELIGLDQGLVLVRRDQAWAVAASHAADPAGSVRFSKTLVAHAAAQRCTVYQGLQAWAARTMSVGDLGGMVVSPVFGVDDEVVGVLYGGRKQRGPLPCAIRPLEAQIVQLLAAAVGANLARLAAVRTRVQFEQFAPPELVRELERQPALLEGRTQEVTVLVSDLRGFTALTERLGAETTFRLVRDVMERLSERIIAEGGVIVDYAGDGILAMWNAPVPQEDHAARACRAALAMLGEVEGLNVRWEATAGGPLRLGIGVNTGPAHVGNTGSSRRLKYGPHGHTVNLASRVQTATKALGVPLLVTAATQKRLPAAFVARPRDPVALPGVAEEVVLYELSVAADMTDH